MEWAQPRKRDGTIEAARAKRHGLREGQRYRLDEQFEELLLGREDRPGGVVGGTGVCCSKGTQR